MEQGELTSVLAKLIDEWYLFRKFDVAHRGKDTLFTPDRQKVSFWSLIFRRFLSDFS